jgi:NADP-dependent 3-hydroxy acid dehydrogenase YdfG
MVAERRKNRSIFICGLSSEIGQKLVNSFADSNTKLFLTDPSQETLEKLEKKISGKAMELQLMRVDSRDAYFVEDSVYKAYSSFGSFDCFINNFSLPNFHTNIVDCSLDYWNRIMNTSLAGVFLHMKYELMLIIGLQKQGFIINIFSSKNNAELKDSHASVTFLFGMKGLMQTLSDSFKNNAIKIISFFRNDEFPKYLKDHSCNNADVPELSEVQKEIINEVKKIINPVGWVV